MSLKVSAYVIEAGSISVDYINGHDLIRIFTAASWSAVASCARLCIDLLTACSQIVIDGTAVFWAFNRM